MTEAWDELDSDTLLGVFMAFGAGIGGSIAYSMGFSLKTCCFGGQWERHSVSRWDSCFGSCFPTKSTNASFSTAEQSKLSRKEHGAANDRNTLPTTVTQECR
ncbi:hypothetical protein SAMN05421858_0630 [Haladaptatus litoreus]|uniref:Uncharacterized protein n=1 Tax=Haladaptatus litoreus TaxID=553468 RepID=A0A1N6W879_9EURY|nr:hypothetical protein SAMN05421858_0630 [Haladaptatus litoreus]